jgi:hypothetical protein
VSVALHSAFIYVESNGCGTMSTMTVELEFHRNARGPTPTDVDCWHLIFDGKAKRLFVGHEWETIRHSGVEEFDIAEFLAQEGEAYGAGGTKNQLSHHALCVSQSSSGSRAMIASVSG